MTSKEAKVHIIDTINGDMNKEYFVNEILPKILQDLDRLKTLENDYDVLETDYDVLEALNECYTKENEKLKKAIDLLKNKLSLYINEYVNFATINAILPVANNDKNRLTQEEFELLKLGWTITTRGI